MKLKKIILTFTAAIIFVAAGIGLVGFSAFAEQENRYCASLNYASLKNESDDRHTTVLYYGAEDNWNGSSYIATSGYIYSRRYDGKAYNFSVAFTAPCDGEITKKGDANKKEDPKASFIVFANTRVNVFKGVLPENDSENVELRLLYTNEFEEKSELVDFYSAINGVTLKGGESIIISFGIADESKYSAQLVSGAQCGGMRIGFTADGTQTESLYRFTMFSSPFTDENSADGMTFSTDKFLAANSAYSFFVLSGAGEAVSVSFTGFDGEAASDVIKTVSGGTVILPDYTGNGFIGWESNGKLYGAGDEVVIIENMIFTAVKGYSIVFNNEDGTELGKKTVRADSEDKTVYLPDCSVAIDGKTFAGWITQSGEIYKIGKAITVESDISFTAAYINFAMTDGSFFRIGADEKTSGVAFESKIGAGVYSDRIKEYGTIVMPVDMLGRKDFSVENYGEKLLKIPCVKSMTETDGTIRYLGGVSEIFERNYARDFCGRGYILFEYSDGETAYLYTAFSEELNCGNVAEMAYAYKNDANSDYKLISAARRAIVDAYAAKRKEA